MTQPHLTYSRMLVLAQRRHAHSPPPPPAMVRESSMPAGPAKATGWSWHDTCTGPDPAGHSDDTPHDNWCEALA